MDSILEPIIRSPRFPQLVEELEEVRTREAEARQAFRAGLDDEVRSEFINGEIVTPMTVRYTHSIIVRNFGRLLGIFVENRQLGEVHTEQSLTVFSRNDYAPDICFWTRAKSSGFHANTTLYPVPDFIAEVLSPATESRDRGVKFEDYAAHSVAEYWILDPDRLTIEQYILRQGRYELAAKLSDGNIRSAVVQGFDVPVKAIFDDQANRDQLRKFLA